MLELTRAAPSRFFRKKFYRGSPVRLEVATLGEGAGLSSRWNLLILRSRLTVVQKRKALKLSQH